LSVNRNDSRHISHVAVLDNCSDINVISSSTLKLLSNNLSVLQINKLEIPITINGLDSKLSCNSFVALPFLDRHLVPFYIVDKEVPLILSLGYLTSHF
jgi:hypothetical protein